MGRRLAWLFALAACGDKPGAYVEIHAGSAVSTVSVYIGQEECTEQNGNDCSIAPMGVPQRLKATVDPGGTWFRDVDTPFVAGASGGVARVHVEASGPNETIQIAVLGRDATGAPKQAAVIHDVHVPSGGTTNLSVTLDDAALVDSNEEGMSPHPDGLFVLPWKADQAPTDCVLVERWQGGTADRTFIVPKEDADCDGYLMTDPVECDQYFFDYSSRAATTSASCATLGHVNSVSSCLLGGTGCSDGSGPTGACLPLPLPEVCVPNSVCDSPCAMAENRAPLSSCASTTSAMFVGCRIYATDPGMPCGTNQFMMPANGTLVLDGLFGNGHTCKDVSYSPEDDLYTTAFQGMQLHAAAPQTLELDVTNRLSGACAFQLDWKAGTTYSPLTAQRGVIDVHVDDDRHMLVPVVLEYNNCTTAPTSGTMYGVTCSIIAGANADSVTNCGQ